MMDIYSNNNKTLHDKINNSLIDLEGDLEDKADFQIEDIKYYQIKEELIELIDFELDLTLHDKINNLCKDLLSKPISPILDT